MRGQSRNVQLVEEMSEKDEYSLYQLSARGQKPFVVTVDVEGQPLPMEIDTGATFSLISESTQKRLWPHKKLLPATIKLKTYTGEPLAVHGSMLAWVQHGKSRAQLSLLVVKGEGPSLIGRDWLGKLRLDWQSIHHVYSNSLQEVLQQHPNVFREGLGTLKGHEIAISVDPNVPPCYCKARSVPYSMRTLVEQELDRLVNEKVIEPIQFSDWAAPIVPVLKSDKKTVRICGDFKMTTNRASKLDRYPIPRIEDLFAKLSGGRIFSKLDMSQAYLQLPLDEKSKSYVVINTHRGLFRYNRLPYGISSAPGIFQRTMENLLQGIPHVGVYLDDILISRETAQEHLRALEMRKCSLVLRMQGYCSRRINVPSCPLL